MLPYERAAFAFCALLSAAIVAWAIKRNTAGSMIVGIGNAWIVAVASILALWA